MAFSSLFLPYGVQALVFLGSYLILLLQKKKEGFDVQEYSLDNWPNFRFTEPVFDTVTVTEVETRVCGQFERVLRIFHYYFFGILNSCWH